MRIKPGLIPAMLLCCMPLWGQHRAGISSPDGKLTVTVSDTGGRPTYQIEYDGTPMLLPSSIGLRTDVGDFTHGMELSGTESGTVSGEYSVPTIKTSYVRYSANTGKFTFSRDGKPSMDVLFRLSDNDVAFRYMVYAPNPATKVCRVWEEATSYVFPDGTGTFLSPQMPPMAGFARTTPSYETPYSEGVPGSNGDGYGYVFPALFKIGESGWVLVSETGVNGSYCGSRLVGNADGTYSLAFPMEEEFNGIGSVAPGITLPGYTPWRTLTVGSTLKPIVETTVAWDVVELVYEPSIQYQGSRGSWSWIIKMDGATVYPVQKEYIDFSAEMGWETVLVDALWDTQIGRENMERLGAYAKEKGVRLFVWYNSNGWWNDAPQGPRGIMNNPVLRRKEMAWLRDKVGAKGIKVDFFGSDKQITMQLYEDILADANDFGLQVVFHGCTLPRGWERMYPNFASAEAVLASENLHFSQHRCDTEAQQACMHPFIRNTVAAMDFGGSTLNKVYNGNNDPSRPGNVRRTSDVFALATAVLFQSSVQHFAMAPNNLDDAPEWAVDFMKDVPTLWDETLFLDGYPGKYAVLARRSGEDWFVVGINAEGKPLKLALDLPMFAKGDIVTLYSDNAALEGSCVQKKLKKGPFKVEIPCNGGFVISSKNVQK